MQDETPIPLVRRQMLQHQVKAAAIVAAVARTDGVACAALPVMGEPRWNPTVCAAESWALQNGARLGVWRWWTRFTCLDRGIRER